MNRPLESKRWTSIPRESSHEWGNTCALPTSHVRARHVLSRYIYRKMIKRLLCIYYWAELGSIHEREKAPRVIWPPSIWASDTSRALTWFTDTFPKPRHMHNGSLKAETCKINIILKYFNFSFFFFLNEKLKIELGDKISGKMKPSTPSNGPGSLSFSGFPFNSSKRKK